MFGGKDKTGDGAPEGLPLICRFFRFGSLSSHSRMKTTETINSISRWRTLILVILESTPKWMFSPDHALSFLFYFVLGITSIVIT
jgi:hypothetical protein